MLELAAMKLLRDKQAERLANAIADNEPKESIARAKKLLMDISAGIVLFTDLKMLSLTPRRSFFGGLDRN